MRKGKKFYMHEFGVPRYWVTSRSIYSKAGPHMSTQSTKKINSPFYNLRLKVKKILRIK